MHLEINKVWILSLLILTGCAGSRVATSNRTTTDYSSYNEDLSSVRPVYAGAPKNVVTENKNTNTAKTPEASTRKNPARKNDTSAEAMHVNRQLDLVMDTIVSQNRSIRYAPGYRIQIYVGNQRQEADDAKLLIYQNFPELSPYLSYNQPTYQLKVGDFMRRIDAERYYSAIRRLISSAQLKTDKVDIRRGLLIK